MKQSQTFFVLFMLMLSLLLVCKPVYAQAVKITTYPQTNTIDIFQNGESSPKKIAITTETDGTGLTFEWRLNGSGKLEGDLGSPGIAYIPPEKIAPPVEQTTIMVEVTDNEGKKANDSVMFILAVKELPPPPQVQIQTVTVKDKNTIMNPTYLLNPGATVTIEAGITKPVGRNIGIGCTATFGEVQINGQQILYTAPNEPDGIDMVTIKALDNDTNEVVVQKLIMIKINE